MALPVINSSPQYELVIPSTGQKVEFRPYLVKEEKVLMVAFESGDQKQATKAIGNTLNACITTDDVDVFELTTYDIEYLFTQIRTKSVGETSRVVIPCTSCEHKNDVEINLETVQIENAENSTETINLTDDILLELCYPTYRRILDQESTGTGEDGLVLAETCVKAILTEEERFDVSELGDGELRDFLENLTTDQFKGITDFLIRIPKLEHTVEFNCVQCKEANTSTLRGMRDFLS